MKRSEKAQATYQKILSVSAKLFMEKGYGKTSIQDVLNELKMSKGAVYHHFKSKEEILHAIDREITAQQLSLIQSVVKKTKGKNARERITKGIAEVLDVNMPATTAHLKLIPAIYRDPFLIVNDLKNQMVVSESIVDVLKEGVQDGSIQTDHPEALAEVFFLLLNIWLNPHLFSRNLQATEKRLEFLKFMMSQLGADIITDELFKRLLKQWSILSELT